MPLLVEGHRDFQTVVDFGGLDVTSIPENTIIIADKNLSLAVEHCAIDTPEATKNWSGVEEIIVYLIQKKANRTTQLMAIGGGALLDLVGFVASIYMRGISWQAIPTTLLAMVDASIGGKTAINYHNTKNLLGTFYPPRSVLIDTSLIKTQTPADIASGKAEVLKMLWTSQRSLHLPNQVNDLVRLAIDLKLEIIKDDWLESTGNRIILNAGHTFGHAFERLDTSLSHGQAVAYGLLAEHDLATLITGQDFATYLLKSVLIDVGLKTDYRYLLTQPNQFINILARDKKNEDSLIKCVLASPNHPAQVWSFSETDIRKFVLTLGL